MKKLMLFSIIFLISFFKVNAQDTTCTLVTLNKVFKFDFYTSEIITSKKQEQGSVFIDVDYNVECLHLWDGDRLTRKVLVTYEDGEVIEQVLDSKDAVFYILGPAKIEVRDQE